MIRVLKRTYYFISRLKFNLQLYVFKKIIHGKLTWPVYEQAGIVGFGTNLVRLLFPVYYDAKKSRQSFSDESINQFSAFFTENDNYDVHTTSIAETIDVILKLPVAEKDIHKPYLDNFFFGVLDAAVLGAMMNKFKPEKIVEIGSGISTRYMRLFKETYNLNTQIICIDPAPRVEISGVADQLINEPLEQAIERNNFDMKPGDILFMDGSHYVFQGNDTLTFFFKLLPSLPPGVIIHIHDIYLPYDYADNVAEQLWTEQYILAAMIMGGFKGYEVLYPAFYVAKTNEKIQSLLKSADDKCGELTIAARPKEGFSFWMKKYK